MRTFAYCRVSTVEQNAETQAHQLKERIPELLDSRIISESISGGVAAMARPAFKNLVDHKLEAGDRLVVLKLDRLGRDAIDVLQTIQHLTSRGISVQSLDLPVSDLSTPEGKLLLSLMTAFAEFEKSRIVERTQEGLARAKAEGKKLGRPVAKGTTEAVKKAREQGLSQSKASEVLGLSLATVKRHWNKSL
ncbi:recombinase family protein [Shewanella algae]|uniref:recombinase family protein n=1 Tax=Shewanella algae TaxID=38313 RepID=UPI0008DDB019|nr:recombinase family protein [Shewanella algae]OHY55853.1 resolvase [Shewanella algae]